MKLSDKQSYEEEVIRSLHSIAEEISELNDTLRATLRDGSMTVQVVR